MMKPAYPLSPGSLAESWASSSQAGRHWDPHVCRSCSVPCRIDKWTLLCAVENTWLEHCCHHHDVHNPLTHVLKHGPGAELAPVVGPPAVSL